MISILIEGEKILIPEWIDRLSEHFSDLCKADVLPGAGHFAHFERPDLTNAEIISFFKSLQIHT